MNKTIAKVGILGLVVFGITECHMITSPAAFAHDTSKTQSLEIDRALDIVEISRTEHQFDRLNYEVITTEPWLKPENQNLMLSDEELFKILESVGFKGYGLKMAWAIVQKESTARPYAHNDNPRTGDNSYGLFQINMYRGLEAARQEAYGLKNNEELFDPYKNAAIAFEISKGGTNWSAWTTYESAKKMLNN